MKHVLDVETIIIREGEMVQCNDVITALFLSNTQIHYAFCYEVLSTFANSYVNIEAV